MATLDWTTDPFSSGVLPDNWGPLSQSEDSGAAGGDEEIEVVPLSVQAAVDKVKELQGRVDALDFIESCGGWQGPGAKAMDSVLNQAKELRASLSAMLQNAQAGLRDGARAFEEADRELAPRY